MDALLSDGHSTQLSHTKSISFHSFLFFWKWEKALKPSTWQPSFFSAPTGRLDWWMKVSGDPVHKQLNVNLFWKVHKSHSLLGTCHKLMHFPFFFLQAEFARAALKISHSLIGFIFFSSSSSFLSGQNNFVPTDEMCHMLSGCKKRQVQRGDFAPPQRVTALSSFPGKPKRKCTWVQSMQQGDQIPPKRRFICQKVSLTFSHWAIFFVHFFQKENMPLTHHLISADRKAIVDVSAQAQDDEHLLVQWRSLPYQGLKDIVVEWRPLLKPDLSFTHFEITQLNQTSLIIKGIPDSLCITAQSTFQPVVLVSCPFWSASFSARLCSHMVPFLTLRVCPLFTRPFWRLQTLQDLCVSQV